MLNSHTVRTNDMPAAMRTLFDQYPRDSWDAHPGFKEKTQHWLGSHQMFRRVGKLVRTETERYLDKTQSAADSRFDAGLEILEKDHHELDSVLDTFTRTANKTIQLIHLDEQQARDEAGHVHSVAETIEAFLQRHLSDEEELAVPIILHHHLRG